MILSATFGRVFFLLETSTYNVGSYIFSLLQAKYHFLILPREKIANLKSLSAKHLDLLRHMQKKGEEIADKYVFYSVGACVSILKPTTQCS